MSKFSIKDRLLSFKYAFSGFAMLLRHEHNSWIHIAMAISAIAMGIYFDIHRYEWIAIIISIGIVLSAEIFNTAIEHIANYIQPKQDIRIKYIKDLAAAGVLITAISSLTVGLIIFLPKFLGLL